MLIEILHGDYINLRHSGHFNLILSFSLLFHVLSQHFYELRQSPRWALAGNYLDILVLTSAMIVFHSTSPLILVLLVLNASLGGFLMAPSFSLRLGLWSACLSNLAFLYLKAQGVPVETQTLLVFNVGLIAGSSIGGFLSFELQDLSAQLEQRSKDLRLLKGLSDLLIDNMGAGLLAVDSQGRIVRSNKGASKIFQMVGMDNTFLYELSDPLWAYVRGCDKTENFELEHENIQGQKMILEAVVSPLSDSEATDSAWVIMVQNRTQIKNLESALRQKEKLAAVGQLAAGIAHEIRNPLASISGSVQLMAGTLAAQSPEDKKLLSIVIKEIDRLNDLITEFLDYVRPDVDATDRVDLDALVKDVLKIAEVNQTLPQGIRVEAQLQSGFVFAGHYDKLKQALLNIIINAYQAMADTEEKVLSVITRKLPEGEAQLQIQDTGTGISKDGVRRIFEPFHTTKAKGTGLGLAITHKILESHGMGVGVTSEVGRGTMFLIEIPTNSD